MKILILGASKTAQKKIIPSIKKIQDLEFDLASISANKKFGEKKRYFDYSEAIKNTRSEIVYISLINSLHFKYAMESLKNSKNVIIDKPFVLNKKELSQILNYSKKKKLLVAEALVFNYHKQFLYLKKLMKNKKMTFHNIFMKFHIPKLDKNNFMLNPKFGGGCFNDMVPYASEIVRIFLKKRFKKFNANIKFNKKLSTDFSVNVINQNIEFYGSFSHSAEYENFISFSGKDNLVELQRFTAPPSNQKLKIKIKNKNKVKEVTVEKNNTFKNFLVEVLKNLKNKRFSYYHSSIKYRQNFKDKILKIQNEK